MELSLESANAFVGLLSRCTGLHMGHMEKEVQGLQPVPSSADATPHLPPPVPFAPPGTFSDMSLLRPPWKPTQWVGLQKLTLSQFCRTESWHQGVSRAVFPLKPPGRLVPCLFQLFIASDIHSLAYSCFTPTSASNFTWLSPHISVSSHGHLLIGHESYWIWVHPNSSETSFELTTSAKTLPHHPRKNMRGVVTVEPCSPNRLNALPLSWSADIARLGSKGRPLPVMVCLERVPGQAGQACPSIEPRDERLFPRICDFFVKITTLYFCFPYTWPVFRMMLQNRIRAFHSWEISCKLTCVFSLTFIIKSEICSLTTY